jgi:hypothetical protein
MVHGRLLSAQKIEAEGKGKADQNADDPRCGLRKARILETRHGIIRQG